MPDYEVIFNNDREIVVFKNRCPNINEAEKMKNLKRSKKGFSNIKKIINNFINYHQFTITTQLKNKLGGR